MRLAVLLIVSGWATVGQAADVWPQWRGPTRDGIATGPFAWPETLNLESTWRYDAVGPSYSGPIVSEDRVFTTATADKKDEVVIALDRATGKEVWKKQWTGSMTVPFFAARNGAWIRATPAFDGKSLYVGGIRDVLVCLDAKDGTERWRFDFVKEMTSPLPAFGNVCSPLVTADGVYVQAGSAFCKLDKATGKLLWKTLEEKTAMMDSAFSSPILTRLGDQEQLVVQTRTKLAGVDPKDGKNLWTTPIPSFRGMNILTPVIFDSSIFTSTYGGNTRLLSVKASEGTGFTTADAWSLRYEGNMTTPVVIDGHAYWYGKDRKMICADLKTGKECWRTEKKYGEYASLVAKGDKILALDATGKLYLVKANPKEYEQLAVAEVSKSETWAHLAVCDDEIYIRDLLGVTRFRWKK